MKRKINFVGWYDQRNIGDEAFRLAHDVLFPDSDKIYDQNSNYDSDSLIVLGGGDVVLPYYIDTIPQSRDFYVLGCGLGYQDEIKFLENRDVKHAIFRNAADAEAALALGMKSEFAPDITFVVDPENYKKSCSLPTSSRAVKKLCVLLTDQISPSPLQKESALLSYFDYFKWELASSLDFLSEFYDIYWLPFSDHENDRDLRIIYDVQGRMAEKQSSYVLPYPGSPEAALSIISEMDLVVSMKFHGVMFSTNLGIPFVNIGVSRKTQLFCEANGYSDLSIKPFCFTRDSLLAAVKAAETEGVPLRLLQDSRRFRIHLLKIRDDVLDKWRC